MPALLPGRPSRGGRLLRWTASVLLLAVLAVALCFLYLRWIGVPAFVKTRMQNRLRPLGVGLDLGRVRLRGTALVANQVRISSAESRTSPETVIDLAEIQLDWEALKRRQLRLRRVLLEGSQLSWVRRGSNAAPASQALGNLTAEVQFGPGDDVRLTHLRGRLLNLDLRGSLAITNASALRSWSIEKGSISARQPWQVRADEVLAQLEKVHFAPESTLEFKVSGDGLASGQLQVDVQIHTPSVRWQTGTLQGGDLTGSFLLHPAGSELSTGRLDLRADRAGLLDGEGQGIFWTANVSGGLTNLTLARLESQLRVDALRSPVGNGQRMVLSVTTVPEGSDRNLLRTRGALEVATVQTPWGEAVSQHFTMDATHGFTVLEPWEARWQADMGPVESIWGGAARLDISGHVRPRASLAQWQLDDPSGRWQRIEPFEFDWSCEVQGVRSPKLQAERLVLVGEWHAPEMALRQLDVSLYGGKIEASAQLDVVDRELVATAQLGFDLGQISPLLTPDSQRWVSQFTWATPPRASASVRLRLPAWTDEPPRWNEELLSTIQAAGEFRGSDGAFRGVPIANARSHFTLTNAVWHLPDLVVQQSDGEASIEFTGDIRTREFRCKLDARLNPKALRPLLDAEAGQRILDEFEFTVPPSVQGEVWGRSQEPQSVGLQAHLAATNFTFRGERCTQFSGTGRLTGQSLYFEEVTVAQDATQIVVPTGSYDLLERVIYVTNAISTMDPDMVTRVIGPKVRAAIRPYHFDVPPRVVVNGRVPTVNPEDADVHFAVVGEKFNYWKLHMPEVKGDVYWHGDALAISNVQAKLCEGDLDWQGTFDFAVPIGAQLAFEGHLRNADLHALMEDLGLRTTNALGSLDAHFKIVNANSDDWRSWEGFGEVRLRDGFLWDIPIFGFVSPILNGIVPGLGKSRVNAGNATFTIDQSVVQTSDLELKSSALRLRYTGSIDFQGAVDMRVQAEILRDAWGVGRLVSMALWPISKAFEYRMTGSLYHPKTEPVYIPKALLWPLHPFKTLKRLFTRGDRPDAPAEAEGPSPAVP